MPTFPTNSYSGSDQKEQHVPHVELTDARNELRKGIVLLRRQQAAKALLTPEQVVFLGAVKALESSVTSAYVRALVAPEQGARTSRNGQKIHAVLIKPVSDRCNLQCSYCYEGKEGERYDIEIMPTETLEQIIACALDQNINSVDFLWHGGEPLLAGLEFFSQGINLQKRYNTNGIVIRNAVQTNGLRLTAEWAAFFKANKFSVGISIDGPKDIHDKQRVGHGGRGSFDRVVQAIALLRSFTIPFGAIAVLTNLHAGRAADTFKLFRNLGIESYDFHPNVPLLTAGTNSLSATAYSEFMIALANEWFSSGSGETRILTFDEFFRFLLGEEPTVCYYAGKCSSIVAVEADGSIVPCTRPFHRQKYTFGNIRSESLGAILEGEKFRSFVAQDQASQTRSLGCPWYSLCHNGCPQHRLNNRGMAAVDGANLYCECQTGQLAGNAAIWTYMVDRIGNIFSDLFQ